MNSDHWLSRHHARQQLVILIEMGRRGGHEEQCDFWQWLIYQGLMWLLRPHSSQPPSTTDPTWPLPILIQNQHLKHSFNNPRAPVNQAALTTTECSLHLIETDASKRLSVTSPLKIIAAKSNVTCVTSVNVHKTLGFISISCHTWGLQVWWKHRKLWPILLY